MSKLGETYQTIVADVARALNPGATIEVGEWIMGPDGDREVDVSVHGETDDGGHHFILIECKDHKRPIGIAVVDALDSKRRDLKADAAVLYSNSGFTAQALLKAHRVGIQIVSAMTDGDKGTRGTITRFFVAGRRSVDSYRMVLYPAEAGDAQFLDRYDYADVYFADALLQKWISKESASILEDIPGPCEVKAYYEFKSPQPLRIRDTQIMMRAIGFWLLCGTGWLGQTVHVSVTKGVFDHISRRVTVPDQQLYLLGPFDNEAWREVSQGPDDPELELNTFSIGLTLFYPVPDIEGHCSPFLEPYIGNAKIEIGIQDAA